MRVMKSKITLLSLAISGLFAASAAHAVVNLVPATPTGAVQIASESTVSSTAPITLTNTGNIFDTMATLGFGVSGGQDRYVRFDLNNGAKWGAAIVAGNLVDMTTGANIANVTVSQGGTTNDSYVVFQITAAAGGIPQADVLLFTPTSITVSSNSSVSITYGLHETAVSAAGPTPSNASLLATKSGGIITFTPAVNITFGSVLTETAAATTSFRYFCSGVAGQPGTAGCASTTTDVDAIVGRITTYALNAGVLANNGGAIANLAVINTAATAVTLTGDFSAASALTANTGAYVDGTTGCTNTPLAGTSAVINSARTVATYTLGNVAFGGTTYLCYRINGTGTPPVPASNYTAAYVPVGQTGYSPQNVNYGVSGVVGSIVRDGVELQSPWFSTNSTQYVTRFFLTNTGSTAASCTVSAFGETGNTLTTGTAVASGVTIPANGQLAVLATDVVSAGSTAGRAAARFVCAAPSVNIQGTYVITHLANGSVSNTPLLRPGTN
ncbi:MAG: hypothetical protein JNM52_03990 [Betaproteobacteria bacterium]|nr:hypothetical protein [Betaproteobacteria bacterium]